MNRVLLLFVLVSELLDGPVQKQNISTAFVMSSCKRRCLKGSGSLETADVTEHVLQFCVWASSELHLL